ncbi:hypothetical protein A3765_08945 [Oleiphilus sp. HI0130]|nr:hypothetical protein A3765_08945 [Oleiphilus sp. HI0130]
MNKLGDGPLSLSLAVCICVFFYFTLFPLSFDWGHAFFERQRLAEVFLIGIGLFVAAVYGLIGKCSMSVSLRHILLLGVLLLIALISAFFSRNPLHSAVYVLHVFLLFGLGFVFQRNLKTHHFKKVLLILVICHSSLVCYSVLFLFFAVLGQDQLDPRVIYFGFDNIRFFNQVQVFVMPLLLFNVAHARIGRLVGLLLFLNLVLMFVGGGLGILLAWILALATAFWLGQRIFAVIGLALTIFAWIAVVILKWSVGLGLDDGTAIVAFTSGGRVELWLEALSQLSWVHIFIGSGPGTFSGVVNGHILSHPHNSILELAVEWGFVSTIIIVTGILFLLKQVISYLLLSGKDEKFLTACLVSFISALALSFVSGVSVMPVSQVLLVFFGAAVMKLSKSALVQTPIAKKETTMVEINSPFFLILILVTSLIYLMLVGYSFWMFDQSNLGPNGPRFWSDGHDIL